MDTGMVMATDTAMVQKVRKNRFFITCCTLSVVLGANAADTQMTPYVDGSLTFTDNVGNASSNEESSLITSVTAGVELEVQGNDGTLSLDYEAEQLIYTHDSKRNQLYNELSFDANKGLFSQTQLRGDVSASITNVARDILQDASTNRYTSETVETQDYEVGLSYQSNAARFTDLYTRVYASANRNEDSEGDNDGFGTEIGFDNGQAIKTIFWTTDFSYISRKGRGSDTETETTEVEHELGLQQIYGLSPFLHVYYEDYIGATEADSVEFASWGPALRYYLHKRTYIELGYEFSLKEENDDYWRGALYINPTQRTEISFDYTKRFYGDAYDFSLSHRNRRVTNTISYVEEVSNFDRNSFVAGDSLEELTLSKSLSWTSTLELRRSTFTLDVSTGENEPLDIESSNTTSNNYGGEINWDRSITRKTSLNASFDYDYYEFEDSGATTREDHYRVWEVEVRYTPLEGLSGSATLSHSNRSSTESTSEYKENSISISVRKQF